MGYRHRMKLLPILITVAAMAILILPRRRQAAAQRALLSQLAAGDRVMCSGGVFGVIEAFSGDVVALRVAPTTLLHVARGAVVRKLTDANTDVPSVAALRGEVGQEDVS
jgi:preprotein translocase subunit YajC